MSSPAKLSISAFLASPGDVEDEREVFYRVVEEHNSAGADRPITALGWELLPPTSGMRPQTLINEMVDACDLFVLVMSRVWGRPATDSPIGTSYTEEEFKRAAARFNATGTPEIVCFFKQVPSMSSQTQAPNWSRSCGLGNRSRIRTTCFIGASQTLRPSGRSCLSTWRCMPRAICQPREFFVGHVQVPLRLLNARVNKLSRPGDSGLGANRVATV